MSNTTYRPDYRDLQRDAIEFFNSLPRRTILTAFEEKHHPVVNPWEEPRIDTTPYRTVLREITKIIPQGVTISHGPVYRVFHFSPGFSQIWWNRVTKKYGLFVQADFEYSLCCRLFGRGADKHTASWTMKAWWAKHDIKEQSFTELERAWHDTGEARAEFAAENEHKRLKKKEQKFNLSRKKEVLDCFSDVPTSSAIAAKANNMDRKILKVYVSRLAKEGLLLKAGPGMYVRTTPVAAVEPVVASAPILAPKVIEPVQKTVAVTVEPIQQAVNTAQTPTRSSNLSGIVTRMNGFKSNLDDITNNVCDYYLPSVDYKPMPVRDSLGLPTMEARELPSLEASIPVCSSAAR